VSREAAFCKAVLEDLRALRKAHLDERERIGKSDPEKWLFEAGMVQAFAEAILTVQHHFRRLVEGNAVACVFCGGVGDEPLPLHGKVICQECFTELCRLSAERKARLTERLALEQRGNRNSSVPGAENCGECRCPMCGDLLAHGEEGICTECALSCDVAGELGAGEDCWRGSG